MDIVFVVDVSGSLKDNDPDNLRIIMLGALADFWRSQIGDKLAVVRFAGWNATVNSEKGVVLFPLEAVPAAGAAQDAFYKKFKDVLDTQLREPVGNGTDFLLALEKGVGAVLDQREKLGSTNKVWVILLTDGTLDVWEGSPSKTAKQYQKYVEEWKNDPQLRTRYHVSEYLTIQAQEMLLKETAPAMVKRAKEIFITPVFFQRTAEKVDLSVLEALGKMGAKPHPLIDSRGGNLFRDVFLKIITLRPGQVWQNRSVYGYQLAEKLPADQPYSRKIHVYGGTRDTRLCLFADSPAFTAQVLNPNNIAGFDPTKVIERGQGEVYRILELGDIPTGDYELQLVGQPDADKKLTKVETAIFSEFQVRPRVKLLGEKQIFQLGDTATFEIALLGKDDQVVTDKDFLSELTAEVVVTRPNGDEDKQVIRFAGKDEARVEYLLEFTGVGGEGQYKLDVRFGGVGGASGGPLDVGGGFGLQAKADLMQLNVLPALRMKLEPWEPLRAQKITLEQAELVGYVADPASVKAEAHFAREGAPKDEPLLTVPLIYDATAGTWSAEMAFPQAGDWEFLISTNETLAVQSAGKEIISVRERTLTVTPSPWQPDLKYWEEHSLEQTFDLKLDLAPGETATVTVEMQGQGAAAENTDAAGQAELSAAAGKVSVTLKINSNKTMPAPPKEPFGDLVFTADIHDVNVKIEHKVTITPTYNDKMKKILMMVAPFAAGALALLILILWFISRPRFLEHQVRPIIPGQEISTAHYLKSFGGRASGDGPPESKGANFRLPKKRANVVVRPLGGDLTVYVNDKEISEPTPLEHGDSVSIQGPEDLHRYLYFAREPQPEELVDPGMALDDEDIVIMGE